MTFYSSSNGNMNIIDINNDFNSNDINKKYIFQKAQYFLEAKIE